MTLLHTLLLFFNLLFRLTSNFYLQIHLHVQTINDQSIKLTELQEDMHQTAASRIELEKSTFKLKAVYKIQRFLRRKKNQMLHKKSSRILFSKIKEERNKSKMKIEKEKNIHLAIQKDKLNAMHQQMEVHTTQKEEALLLVIELRKMQVTLEEKIEKQQHANTQTAEQVNQKATL